MMPVVISGNNLGEATTLSGNNFYEATRGINSWELGVIAFGRSAKQIPKTLSAYYSSACRHFGIHHRACRPLTTDCP
jgi:hypothetical protein